MNRFPYHLLILLVFGWSASVAAQSPTSDSLWHRYFEYLATDSAQAADGRLPAPGRRGAAQNSTVEFTPDGPEFSEQVLPPGEPPPQYESRPDANVELDDDTSAPDALNYSRLFTPSIAPYKRLGIRDRIADDARSPQLAISESPRRPLPVQADFGEGRQTFVGTMRIRSDGTPVPIPSPSPELQVHQATIDTGASPRFLVDDSDALFVELPAGEHEVRMLVSSPLSYFGGPLPSGQRVQPSRNYPILDPLADEVLRLAGTSRRQTDVEIVSALARYLHGFEPVEAPEDLPDDDLYMTLARRREGVCRHRALIFTATLLSVGVPARYVFNEAHAFAEVQLQNGWRRIELGGAAEALDVLGDTQTDRAFDHPDDELLPPDPLNMESRDASIDGDSVDETGQPGDESDHSQTSQNDDGPAHQTATPPDPNAARTNPTEATTDATPAPHTGDTTDGTGDPTADPHADGTAPADATSQTQSSIEEADAGIPPSDDAASTIAMDPLDLGPDAAGDEPAGEPAEEEAAQPRVPSYLVRVSTPTRAVRREQLSVDGQLVDDMQNPISFQSVRAFIETSTDREGIEVGEAVTDQSGRFRIEFSLPASLPAGPAELVIRFDGTPLLAPAEFR